MKKAPFPRNVIITALLCAGTLVFNLASNCVWYERFAYFPPIMVYIELLVTSNNFRNSL